MNVDWLDLFIHIGLPVIFPGLISIWLYYAQTRHNRPKVKVEIDVTRAKTIESLSHSLDLLTEQLEEIMAKDLDKQKIINEIQSQLAAEIIARKQMEAQFLNLQKENKANIDGIQILILQMEKLGIEPAWRPQL